MRAAKLVHEFLRLPKSQDALASFPTSAARSAPVPLAALLLATDGYGNAQADEP